MLDRAPRTRKLRPGVFHLAEWAPEAAMILLAASHIFFVRKDVRHFIWFELIKSVSFWKVFRRTSPDITMLLFCFWPDIQLPKENPHPYPVQNILQHGYGAIDGGLFRRHLQAISASKQVE